MDASYETGILIPQYSKARPAFQEILQLILAIIRYDSHDTESSIVQIPVRMENDPESMLKRPITHEDVLRGCVIIGLYHIWNGRHRFAKNLQLVAARTKLLWSGRSQKQEVKPYLKRPFGAAVLKTNKDYTKHQRQVRDIGRKAECSHSKELPDLPAELYTEILKRTDLYTCLALCDFDAAKAFLQRKEDAEAAFLQALKNGGIEQIKLLLAHVKIPSPKFLLKEAYLAGNLDVVQWLESNGQEIWTDCYYHLCYDDEVTKGYLVEAARQGQTNVVAHMMKEYHHISYWDLQAAWTAALENHHTETALFLISEHLKQHFENSNYPYY